MFPSHSARALLGRTRNSALRSVLRVGSTLVAAAALTLVGALRPPVADAAFHVTAVDEIMVSYNGNDAVQFIEMRMVVGNQHITGGSVLGVFDATGTFQGVHYTVPTNVGEGADRAWLMGTAVFQTISGITPDFVIPGGLPTADAMLCWGKPADPADADLYVDCIAYGNYTGPSQHHVGLPTPMLPVGHSLVRVGDTDNVIDDFACGDPAVAENNSGIQAVLPATEPCPVCGDDLREGSEQCDGTDDAGCPGLCDGMCRCGNLCGDDQIEPGEQCDGTDADACAADCQFNCTCGPAGPLAASQTKCPKGFIKGAAKVVASYGRTISKCVDDIGKGRTTSSVTNCIGSSGVKLAKTEGRVDDAIDAFCSTPYAVDCPVPCEAADSGGLSAAIDDDTELKACLLCLDKAVSFTGGSALTPSGVHGALLHDVTLATANTDPGLAKCQSKVVKGAQGLFGKTIKEIVKLGVTAMKGQTPPVGDLVIGTDAKGKIARARAKLARDLEVCASAPFENGACPALSGSALSDCITGLVACKACVWGNAMLGSTVDCDLIDDGQDDGSCD